MTIPYTITGQPRANKTDAGNGSKAICRVSNVLRSPSPDPKRSPNFCALSVNKDLPEPYDLSGVVFPCTRPLRRLRLRLAEKFSEDVARADVRFFDLWDDNYPINGDWLTRFAETTAQAMIRRDGSSVDGHLATILQTFQRGGDYIRGLIDVNYMEDLFYQVEDIDAQWGWLRVPPPLRQLYIDYWGGIIPRFVERLQPTESSQ